MMPSTMTVARLERIAHWISGGTSGSASFTAGWLKPQVRQMNTTSTMLAASSGRVWLAGMSVIATTHDLYRKPVPFPDKPGRSAPA